MLIISCLLLMLQVGRCKDNQEFGTTVVRVGQDVTLTCSYDITKDIETYYWIKIFENMPEILGKGFSYDFVDKRMIPRMNTEQKPGRFNLTITKTTMSDTGFYYCLKSSRHNITFLKGTFLRVKRPEPHVNAVIQDLPPDPVHPGDPVTLRCSVVFGSGEKTCPEDHSVFWFRVGLDESQSTLIYAHGNSRDQCWGGSDGGSPQTCVYSFSKNVSSSEAGTYHCAVATCGHILFGNGTNLEVEVVNQCDSQNDSTVLLLLSVSLAASLIVIVVLVSVRRKTSCNCCNATPTDVNQPSQINEDTLVYSTPTFTRTKGPKAGRGATAVIDETTYTDVRAFVID